MTKYPKLKFQVHNFNREQHGAFVWGTGRKDIFDLFYSANETSDPEKAAITYEEIL